MPDERSFAVRHTIEEWNKPKEPGPHGYADMVFLASIIKMPNRISVVLVDSETKGPPSREMLKFVKATIECYLDEMDREEQTAASGSATERETKPTPT